MRWAAYLWTAACCGLAAVPATAHERATATIEQPTEGAVVEGTSVAVVLTASVGGTPAEFRLLLDGRPVDEAGAVGTGALFTTFRLPSGTAKTLVVRLDEPGEHTLRLEPTAHADRPEQPVVRRFVSKGGSSGGGVRMVLAAALVGAGLVAAATYARSRR